MLTDEVGSSLRAGRRRSAMGHRSWSAREIGQSWSLGPRAKLGAKAALAAGVAWQLAELFPSPISQYAYYAPLGALLAMYPSLASSVRAGVQTLLGILFGATIALAVDALLPTNALTIALVIGAGVGAGAVPWLGEQRAWVPFTALFVLTIGQAGSMAYPVSLLVLTLVGVTVGTLVNFLVFPPLHLRETERALRALQELVAEQLDEIADGLEQNEVPDRDAWEQRTRDVAPTVSTMHQAVGELWSSTRGNPRAIRHREDTAWQERQAQAFKRMALLVEDLVDVLAEVEQADVPALPFDDRVRLQCADATRRLSELTRYWADHHASAEENDRLNSLVQSACRSLVTLEDSVAEDPASGGADPFVAGSVVTTLRRCLGAMVVCGGRTAIEQNRADLFR
jgi:uncharacterized membrane protein YgaE (UPF0421/DUF939 family)